MQVSKSVLKRLHVQTMGRMPENCDVENVVMQGNAYLIQTPDGGAIGAICDDCGEPLGNTEQHTCAN
jgi:hypothetical protein